MVKLLLGLFAPNRGSIIYGDEADRAAYVPQDIPKFPITVREYLALGLQDNPSDIEMNDVIKEVGLDKKEGLLDSMIGRSFGGVELSGGQWQRLSIAKALLDKSTWYVFDEPTSAIDPIQESEIYESILKATKGKTTFIVTHRLALCPHVDKVLLIEDGKIVEYDSNDSFMKKSGTYSSMYRSQQSGYA